MKRIILCLLISVSSVFNSQAQVSGKIIYDHTFNWIKFIKTADFLSQEEKDRSEQTWKNDEDRAVEMQLTFTPEKSYYTYLKETQTSADGSYTWVPDAFIVTRDLTNQTIFEIEETLGKKYLISGPMQAPAWKIGSEIKEVLGYMCMKATMHDPVKDMDWEAWFSFDIPVSVGPDWYYGLPGVILEMNSTNGVVNIVATSVNLEETTIPELPKKLKGKEITRTELDQMLVQYIKQQEEIHNLPYAMRF